MIHRLRWRVASDEALEFWAERLAREGVEFDEAAGDQATLAFRDPEGLGLELGVVETDDEPLRAAADGIAPRHALLGFDGVRAYSASPSDEERLLTEELGFRMIAPGSYVVAGGRRQATFVHDEPPPAAGIQGAGTVHHIAWCDRDAEHTAWQQHLSRIGVRPTPVIDRQYFLSIYFREPRGVLFELATPSPGFAIDEPPDHLGEALRLPPQYEHLRNRLEPVLTPLENPRTTAARQ
jgi:glyoxalase family protein